MPHTSTSTRQHFLENDHVTSLINAILVIIIKVTWALAGKIQQTLSVNIRRYSSLSVAISDHHGRFLRRQAKIQNLPCEIARLACKMIASYKVYQCLHKYPPHWDTFAKETSYKLSHNFASFEAKMLMDDTDSNQEADTQSSSEETTSFKCADRLTMKE